MWEGVGSKTNNDKNLFISAFRHHHEKQLYWSRLRITVFRLNSGIYRYLFFQAG